jgi:NAD(P)-dependent dehydrogenase (short-subunit alcohol dehydrogenase family)
MNHLEAPRNVVVVIGAGGMGLAVARRLAGVASMAGHFASLPPDLERHLATAPADQLRVQAAAHAWGGKGARLNTISPGVISTPMGLAELRGPAGAHIQSMIDLSGARRAGTPTTSPPQQPSSPDRSPPSCHTAPTPAASGRPPGRTVPRKNPTRGPFGPNARRRYRSARSNRRDGWLAV